MPEPFLIFGAPAIGEEEIAEVVACLRSGWIGTGPRVAQFERDFATYQGLQATQVAAVNSCTAALHVSMVAAGLDPGAEVITTPLTFCASVNAIIHAGLTPVLADVDPATQCINPDAIEAAITPRTQAILPVHFAGRACEMDRIMAIADKHGLMVIEDCAHAIETEYKGRKAGSFGDFGCFSFYATKNVITGEGGMIVGRDEARIAQAIVPAHGHFMLQCKIVPASTSQNRASGALSSNPVFDLQRGHSGELSHVVGHHDQPFAAGMGRDVHVVDTNWLAESFQGGTNGAIVLRSFAAVGEHLEPAAKVLDDCQIFADLAAFFSPMEKLGQGDGGNRHPIGVPIEG